MRTREELQGRIKELKEQVLSNARSKMGISEEKREEFKKRSAEAKAKRKQKTQAQTAETAKATGTSSTPVAAITAPGPLKRADMDPNRSTMVQRVNQEMANTGATRADARGAVVARRDARQQQLNKIQSEQGVSRRQAQGIMKYGNKTAVAPEGGGPAVANYQLAKRIVQMAKNKDLTRSEAAGVIASRRRPPVVHSQPPTA